MLKSKDNYQNFQKHIHTTMIHTYTSTYKLNQLVTKTL